MYKTMQTIIKQIVPNKPKIEPVDPESKDLTESLSDIPNILLNTIFIKI
jgi:hypothetical protein